MVNNMSVNVYVVLTLPIDAQKGTQGPPETPKPHFESCWIILRETK